MSFLNLKDYEVSLLREVPEIYRMTPPLSRHSALFWGCEKLVEKRDSPLLAEFPTAQLFRAYRKTKNINFINYLQN